jgi:MipA family protein
VAAAAAAAETRDWDLTVGVAGANEPNYSGASATSWRWVVWADGAYRTDGFGTVALDSGSLTIAPEVRWDVLDSTDTGVGPLIGYRSGRSNYNPGFPSADHGSTLPPGLPTVKGAIDAGLAGHVTIFGLPLFAQVRAALGGPQGGLVNMGAYMPFEPTPDLEVTVLPTVTWANARQMNAFYGVSAATSMASGLTSFDPGGGWENAAIEFGVDWRVSGEWHIIASAAYLRLLGNAVHSPIVQTPNQPSALLGIARQF